MDDNPPRSESQTQTATKAQAEARVAEAAATRRRWITLGEVLAVLAVIISGLTLWNNWSERGASEAAKHADEKQANTRSATLVLLATNSGKRELLLKPASAEQSVQEQHISFPAALGIAPTDTTGEPRIEATWFEHALIKARGAAHLPGESRGDEQLPIAITTHFLSSGEPHTDVAIYDVGYSIAGGWFGSHSLTLRGIALVARVKMGSEPAQLGARWNKSLRHK